MFSPIPPSDYRHPIETTSTEPLPALTHRPPQIHIDIPPNEKPPIRRLHSQESTLHPHSCINMGCITRTNQLGLAVLSISFFSFAAYKYFLGETSLASISLLFSLIPPLNACWMERLHPLAQRGLEINEAKKTALLFRETTIHTNENMKIQQTGLSHLHNDLTKSAQTLTHLEEVIEEEEVKGQTLANTMIQSIEENARSQAEDHIQLQAASEMAEKQQIQLSESQKKLREAAKEIAPEIKLYAQTVEKLHAEVNKFKDEGEKHFKRAEEYKTSLEMSQKNTEEIIQERKTLQLENEKMASQIKELSNKIDELNAGIASLQKENTLSTKLIETLEKKIKVDEALLNEFKKRVGEENWKVFREYIHTMGTQHKRRKSLPVEFKQQ